MSYVTKDHLSDFTEKLLTNDKAIRDELKEEISNISGGGGSYTLPTASDTELGGVKIDGTTITIDGEGIISAVAGGSDDAKENRKNYIYNADKLKLIKTKPTFDTIVIGDSIAAGSGATPTNGFISQVRNVMDTKSGGNFHSINYPYDHSYDQAKNWTKENDGILLKLISTSNTAYTIMDFNKSQTWDIPSVERKVVVVYSKRPGAGSFKVTVDTTDVETVSCDGTKEDGVLTQAYTVPAKKVVTITPVGDGDVYINAFLEDVITDKQYYKLNNISVGGRQAQEYNTDQIDTMLTFVDYDLLIWEVFANDYGLGTYEGYEPIARHALAKAREQGKDILIPIACRSASIKTEEWIEKFNKFKKLQYDLAKEFDACIIDFDIMFGEDNATANANGLMSDGIHPNDNGHTLMADEVCKVLFNREAGNLDRGNYPYTNNSAHAQYQHIVRKEDNYYTGSNIFENITMPVVDYNGNKGNVSPLLPLVRNNDSTKLPKYCVKGTIASTVTNNQLYVNESAPNVQAVWSPALTVPCLPIYTSLPTATKKLLGTLAILNNSDAYSIHVCLQNTSSAYEWKKVIDIA